MDAPWQVHRTGMSAYDNVMSQVRREDECLIFTGFIAANGYGRVETKETGPVGVHRVVAERHYGPSDLHVLHSCDNPTCVEPRHLRYGTIAENALDKKARERAPRGVSNPKSLLTEEAVREIRASTLPSNVLGAKYGVAGRTIRNVRTRRTWAWVD